MTSSSGETSISMCGIYSFELINERRTNGGPGCSSLEAALQENGVSVVELGFPGSLTESSIGE